MVAIIATACALLCACFILSALQIRLLPHSLAARVIGRYTLLFFLWPVLSAIDLISTTLEGVGTGTGSLFSWIAGRNYRSRKRSAYGEAYYRSARSSSGRRKPRSAVARRDNRGKHSRRA